MNEAHFNCIRVGHGYYTFEIETYSDFLREVVPLFSGTSARFVWRGALNPNWPLVSSIARHLCHVRLEGEAWQRQATASIISHLISFLQNLRGCTSLTQEHHALFDNLLGFENDPPDSFLNVLGELSPLHRRIVYELFSTGQHHGLATPFLDWTTIPSIALYFAFKECGQLQEGVGRRAVYALNRGYITRKFPFNLRNPRRDSFLFVDSMAHDNPRIVGQNGVFTYTPTNRPIEDWIVENIDENETHPVLIRFLIRNWHRESCIHELAMQNITDRSLFPDTIGASGDSNYRLSYSLSKPGLRNSIP